MQLTPEHTDFMSFGCPPRNGTAGLCGSSTFKFLMIFLHFTYMYMGVYICMCMCVDVQAYIGLSEDNS